MNSLMKAVRRYRAQVPIRLELNARSVPRMLVLSSAAIMGQAISLPSVADPSIGATSPEKEVRALPLTSIDKLQFVGGFTLPADTFGESSLNYALPVIEKFGDSLFIVGNAQDDAIAEFRVPELVDSLRIVDLDDAGAPVQNFSSVLGRVAGGNPESINQINGLEIFDGQLIVNGIEYYDGSGDNRSTTLAVSNGSDLAGATVKGFHRLPGAAKAAGWISELPPEWQSALERTHLSGSSSGDPIISRLSVGPSAYAVDAQEIVNAASRGAAIGSTKLLEFSLGNPLARDLYNDAGSNDLWTHTAKAVYGFVVPGTRTYATFGHVSGTESGLGYKITQDDGTECAGYCSRKADDRYNYYWFWDMNDLLDVKAGAKLGHDVRPYAYGKFDVPFQNGSFQSIAGGSFDSGDGTLYFSVDRANNTLGQYDNPPVIAAFRFSER